jgi:hypothetical protein
MAINSGKADISVLDEQLAAAGLPTGNTIWVNLANAIMEAYSAYSNDSTPSLPGYHYVTSIWVQEATEDSDATVGAGQAEAAAATVEIKAAQPEGVLPPWQGNTLFGFAAYADDLSHNIIVLRGTVTDEEAGYDLYGWGTNTPCMLPSGNPNQSYGNVKQDLYDFYTETDEGLYVSLAASFNAAVQQVAQANPNKTWIVAAHSLGGPLATLGALDAYVSGSYTNSALAPWLVTFGSLHLGDQSFATAFKQNVPTAFRFANLCDFVPSLVSLEPVTLPDPYVHVGLECTFVWQTWSDWGNHSMQSIYLSVVRDYPSVIHVGPRKYPQ